MNKSQKNSLTSHRVKIVEDLEPKDVLPRLVEDGIITDNDVEAISSERTRRARCHELLSIVQRRGPKAYSVLRRSLEESYPHLSSLLDLVDEEATTEEQHSELHSEVELVLNRDSKLLESLSPVMSLLLANVEPTDIIDWHIQEGTLTEDGSDRIKSERTRKQRCVLFLNQLTKCEKPVFDILKILATSLKRKYGFITNELNRINPTLFRNKSIHSSSSCIKRKGTETETGPAKIQKTRTNLLGSINRTETETLKNSTFTLNHKGTELQKGYPNITKALEGVGVDVLEKDFVPLLGNAAQKRQGFSNTEFYGADVFSFHNKPGESFSKHEDTIIVEETLPKRPRIYQNCSDCEGQVDAFIQNRDSPHILVPPTSTVDRNKVSDKRHKYFVSKHSTLPCSSVPSSIGTLTSEHTTSECSEYVCHIDERKQIKRKKKRKRLELDKNDCQELVQNQNLEYSSKTDVILTEEMTSTLLRILEPVSVSPMHRPNQKHALAHDQLNKILTEGRFREFDVLCGRVRDKFSSNADIMYLLQSVKICYHVYKGEFKLAKEHLKSAMVIGRRTPNPNRNLVDCLKFKAWKYIIKGTKLGKLQDILDEAKMLIEEDPMRYVGHTAAWIYLFDARSKYFQFPRLSQKGKNAQAALKQLRTDISKSFNKAIENFQREPGIDGLYGIGFSLCHMAMFLLQCGENGASMKDPWLFPTQENIKTAGDLLWHVESSNLPIPKICKITFLLAKCDFQFRKNNISKALELAQEALNLAMEIDRPQLCEYASTRLAILNNTKDRIIELRDEDVERLLFGSTDTEVTADENP